MWSADEGKWKAEDLEQRDPSEHRKIIQWVEAAEGVD